MPGVESLLVRRALRWWVLMSRSSDSDDGGVRASSVVRRTKEQGEWTVQKSNRRGGDESVALGYRVRCLINPDFGVGSDLSLVLTWLTSYPSDAVLPLHKEPTAMFAYVRFVVQSCRTGQDFSRCR